MKKEKVLTVVIALFQITMFCIALYNFILYNYKTTFTISCPGIILLLWMFDLTQNE